MSWFWIGMAVAVPAVVAILLALPFWLNDAPLAGNLIGAGVILMSAIGSVVREHSDIQRALLQCTGSGKPCLIHPAPFIRFAIYGGIGLAEVAALFALGLWVEERRRRRLLDPDWR